MLVQESIGNDMLARLKRRPATRRVGVNGAPAAQGNIIHLLSRNIPLQQVNHASRLRSFSTSMAMKPATSTAPMQA
jgi:hypothetical protein